MKTETNRRSWFRDVALPAVGIFVAVAFGVWLLRPPGPDRELVRTARDAMHMADEARQETVSVARHSSTVRIAVLVIGVAGMLAVAWLVCRSTEKDDVSSAEVLDVLLTKHLDARDGPNKGGDG